MSRECKEVLFSDRLNFSRYHEKPFVFHGNNVNMLKDMDKVELWKDIYLEVIANPGHDKGCLCYKIDSCFFPETLLFPG